MNMIIDGYNLLHILSPRLSLNAAQLQRERDRLLDRLSDYGRQKGLEITVVFDGWQGGWITEQRERRKGIEVIYSKVGEKADDVIKRLVRERGSGSMVITSDRDISKDAERMSVAVIPSDQFREKLEQSAVEVKTFLKDEEEGEGRGIKKKGLSRRLSKKEKRRRTALRKL
jgi:predicted RNA-binding protein with PIN domain